MTLPNIHRPRVLLMQIRDDTTVRIEEYQSFLAYSGLSEDQLDVLNVFDIPNFDAEVLEGYDALFVGGASEASVLEPEHYPFVMPAIALLQHCIRESTPVFASCFGFQLAVLALGGEIIRDGDDYEMGTPLMLLSDAAANDVLFKTTAKAFPAVSVHRERAAALPMGCELLAYTDACPHAFKVTDKPFWAFQFHPEVDRATLIERLTTYKKTYTDNDGQLDEVLASAVETPESNKLLRRFVERVLG
jgi:GMP synthase (glutamine-hydrolysing)